MNFRYLGKSIIFQPATFLSELFEDLKKDIKAKSYSSKYYSVWISGLPKSGTTLVEEILKCLPYVKIDRSALRNFYKMDEEHIVNYPEKYLNCFPKKKFTYVKTHLKYNENFLLTLNKKNFKTFVIFRDIRDVMISRYYHIMSDEKHWQHKLLKNLPEKDGFIKSLYFKTDLYPAKKFQEPIKYYFNWIKDWLKAEQNKNVKFLWYEDYINNPIFFISEILKFLNFSEFDPNRIENEMFKRREREKEIPLNKKLNRIGKNVSTFRLGSSGYWKKIFDEKTSKFFFENLPGDIQEVLNKKI